MVQHVRPRAFQETPGLRPLPLHLSTVYKLSCRSGQGSVLECPEYFVLSCGRSPSPEAPNRKAPHTQQLLLINLWPKRVFLTISISTYLIRTMCVVLHAAMRLPKNRTVIESITIYTVLPVVLASPNQGPSSSALSRLLKVTVEVTARGLDQVPWPLRVIPAEVAQASCYYMVKIYSIIVVLYCDMYSILHHVTLVAAFCKQRLQRWRLFLS